MSGLPFAVMTDAFFRGLFYQWAAYAAFNIGMSDADISFHLDFLLNEPKVRLLKLSRHFHDLAYACAVKVGDSHYRAYQVLAWLYDLAAERVS